jgi:protein tyrosine phosphatase (PTP) superfamily phosphohydrolase (DUF442 family)
LRRTPTPQHGISKANVCMNSVWVDIPNCRFPCEGMTTGGLPSRQHLLQGRDGGVRVVVDLCSASEARQCNELALVPTFGMKYVPIPINGPYDLNEVNARRLGVALDDAAKWPVLLHCATGNRAGGLLALKAFFVDRLPMEQAIRMGRAGGLNYLEGDVRCAMARTG